MNIIFKHKFIKKDIISPGDAVAGDGL